MKILITICARGGSKRVKNKNIRLIAGKPLMAHTINTAKLWITKNSQHEFKIVCSTDSETFADIAKEYGVSVPFIRPDDLANDNAGKTPAVRHALLESEKIYDTKYDIIVDLDVSSPLRKSNDLDNCLELFLQKNPDVLFSVVNARRNPYYNMVEEKTDGFVELSKPPQNAIVRSQNAPKVYDMNASIYFYNRNYLVNTSDKSVVFAKKATVYVMDNITSFDIDSENDLRYVDYLISNGVYHLD